MDKPGTKVKYEFSVGTDVLVIDVYKVKECAAGDYPTDFGYPFSITI